MNCLKVNYHLYYDLVFRTKYNFLVPCVYVIDFFDYVKAGICYNTRGYEMSSRKIDFFVEVYNDLQSNKCTPTVIRGLQYFYEDIFNLYSNYFNSAQSDKIESEYVAFIPEFKKVSFLYGLCQVETIDLQSYESPNTDDTLFSIGTPSVYFCTQKQVQALTAAYDCKVARNVLMEVTNAYI